MNNSIEPARFIDSSNIPMNECSICFFEINISNKYTLECNHTFHTECAINWFRLGNATCPLCREVNNTDMQMNYCNIYTCNMSKKNWEYAKFSYMKTVIKNNNAPKDLIKRFNKYNKFTEKYKHSKLLMTKWRKTNEYKNYIKSRKTTLKLNYQIYKISKKIKEVKMEICAYPIIPYKFTPKPTPKPTQKPIKKYNTRSQNKIN